MTMDSAANSSGSVSDASIHTMMAHAASGTNGPPGAQNGLPAIATLRAHDGTTRAADEYSISVPELATSASWRKDPDAAATKHSSV